MTAASGPAPKILFFFAGAFVARENGAHWRAFSALRFLIDNGFDVAVYTYHNDRVRPWNETDKRLFHEHFPEASLHFDTQSGVLRWAARIKKFVTGIAPTRTAAISRMRLPGATPVYDRLQAAGYRTAFITYATSALDMNGLDLDHTVVETQDVLFVQLAKTSGRPIYSARVVQKFRTEMSIMDRSALSVSLANADANLFHLCLDAKPILFIPDFPVAAPEPRRSPDAPSGRLLFVGSDNVFNVAGLVRFLKTHSDTVRRFGLDIAGKVSLHPDVQAFAGTIDNLRLLGFVDDLQALYAGARAVISPVDGTGIKIKVLEALSAGVPVFASAHTMQGLPPGFEQCVFPLEAMPALLPDRAALEQASSNARLWYDGLAQTPDLNTLLMEMRRLAQ